MSRIVLGINVSAFCFQCPKFGVTIHSWKIQNPNNCITKSAHDKEINQWEGNHVVLDRRKRKMKRA